MTTTIKTMIFGARPERAFKADGCLHTFEATGAESLLACCESAGEQADLVARLSALVDAGGYDVSELTAGAETHEEWARQIDEGMADEDQLMAGEDGRLAVVGPTGEGLDFALEVAMSPASLAHLRRIEVRKIVRKIEAHRLTPGTRRNLQTMADRLNDLEELRIDLNTDLEPIAEGIVKDIDELAWLAGAELDCCDLPTWSAATRGSLSVSADGAHALYPSNDELVAANPDDNLSTGSAGWRVEEIG